MILSAGESKRFGAQKLETIYKGKRLLQWSIDTVRELQTDKLIVISKYLNRYLFDIDGFEIIVNESTELGLSESIKCAIKRAQGYEAIMIFLGDMPLVDINLPNEVLLMAERNSKIIFPSHNGIKGFPVYLPSKYFDDALKLKGDVGLKDVILRHVGDLLTFEGGERCIFDIDTKMDIKKW